MKTTELHSRAYAIVQTEYAWLFISLFIEVGDCSVCGVPACNENKVDLTGPLDSKPGPSATRNVACSSGRCAAWGNGA